MPAIKSFLFAALLMLALLLVGAEAKKRRGSLCFDKSFSCNIFSISNRILGWDAFSELWFDSVNQRVRIDTKIMDPIERVDQWFLMHDKGVGYRYDPRLKTCRKFSIRKGMRSTCLPEQGVHRRSQKLTIGRSITDAETYVIKSQKRHKKGEEDCHRGNYVSELCVEPQSEEHNIGIPISFTTYGGPYSGMLHTAWTNYESYGDKGIEDEKVWELPEECTKDRLYEAPYPTEHEVPVGPWFFDQLFGQ